jgi:hypothetical protein
VRERVPVLLHDIEIPADRRRDREVDEPTDVRQKLKNASRKPAIDCAEFAVRVGDDGDAVRCELHHPEFAKVAAYEAGQEKASMNVLMVARNKRQSPIRASERHATVLRNSKEGMTRDSEAEVRAAQTGTLKRKRYPAPGCTAAGR